MSEAHCLSFLRRWTTLFKFFSTGLKASPLNDATLPADELRNMELVAIASLDPGFKFPERRNPQKYLGGKSACDDAHHGRAFASWSASRGSSARKFVSSSPSLGVGRDPHIWPYVIAS